MSAQTPGGAEFSIAAKIVVSSGQIIPVRRSLSMVSGSLVDPEAD